jgi:rhodanese-related sulfurtransferase
MNQTTKRLITAALSSALFFSSSAVLAEDKPITELDVQEQAINLANQTIEGGYTLMKIEELKALIDSGEDFVLIDAHPRREFVLAYIDGATNFGFQSKRAGVWEEDVDIDGGATQEEYKAALGDDMDKKIVIYCGFTRCGRSHNAAMWARSMGYTNVYRAPGGVTGWVQAGYPYKTIP